MAYWAEGKVGILILPDKIEYKDVLAHEAVHLASYLFKMRGIRHDLDNEEPYSYLVGWFVEEIDKFCNKK